MLQSRERHPRSHRDNVSGWDASRFEQLAADRFQPLGAAYHARSFTFVNGPSLLDDGGMGMTGGPFPPSSVPISTTQAIEILS